MVQKNVPSVPQDAVCEFGTKLLSPFQARKLCHTASGVMLLSLDPGGLRRQARGSEIGSEVRF